MRVLITGAADGIGKALLELYVARGAEVVGVDVDAERAAPLEHEHGVTFELVDLSDREAVDALAAKLAEGDAFDVVVHNAGISCVGRFARSDLDAQRAVHAVNLEAPLVLTAALLGTDRVRAGGSIAFVSSLSHQVGYPGAAVYAATKDGLASYARSLSVALAPKRIHVLRVFPGPTRTVHAARYAPKGSDASKRMPPERTAKAIVRAIDRRKRVCVPGFGTRLIAGLGPKLPRLMDRTMRKAILEPLDRDAASKRQRRA
ncbi:MAG: SDR family NAD(P)-dependent oxidoreductase [Planctomycetota bacterium]|nr:SDR family NAD(P)-dependent oxidoreductase [Planctomycetota bacterium]